MLRRIFLSLTLLLSLFGPTGIASAQSLESSWLPPDEVAALPVITEASAPLYQVASFGATFDTSRYPKDRKAIDAGPSFPDLHGQYEVLAPGFHRRYNCIAHSLGIHNRWVNPETGPASNPLGLMDNMYRTKGYQRVKGLDYRLFAGIQKVVVYAKVRNGRIVEVTHGALQERDGTWTSKLGQLALIRHRTPDALDGPTYGRPVAVYHRRFAGALLTGATTADGFLPADLP